MRKQTKLVAVLSAAALLAVGASMTSFAATRNPWVDLGDGDYAYVGSDGERVTGEWRRSGNDYFFLDETGVMAKSRLITPDDGDSDSYYYVGGTGARLKNQWVRVMNEDQETVNDQVPEMFWYYLGTNGKAVKAADDALFKKTVINYNGSNRTFFFDSEGRMVTGWIKVGESTDENNVYYCDVDGSVSGVEGAAVTGWVELEVPDDWDSSGDKEYDVVEWFYFDGGKMKKADAAGQPKVMYKDGWYYSFDENGVLLDDWHKVELQATPNTIVGTDTNVDGFTTSIGTKGTGWIYTDKNDDGEYKHYYLVAFKDATGTVRNIPFNSINNNGGEMWRAKTINGKVYVFNGKGELQSGVKEISADKGNGTTWIDDDGKTVYGLPKGNEGGAAAKELKEGIYFFNNGDRSVKGQMMTGRQTVTDEGETYTYYFNKQTGAAETNKVIDGALYGSDGKRIEAENGNTYEIVHLDEKVEIMSGKTVKDVIPAGSDVIVSSNGKLRTTESGYVKVDGVQYKVNKHDPNNENINPWSVDEKPED